ncbi:response regulator transcription factor [Nocardia carnea]|uniref:response regulator transcription factor n=1 Tax=Nocardia carnea TaxID=37328 RepID=UPI002456A638|nr:response regulator transcription factor [Nocardia carnea]
MCILVADDDPVVREVVRRYLERDGRTVVETGDGRAAHAVLARTGTPDDVELAVLDVMMPEPSGIDLCRAVRAGRRPDLPIILLTALGDEDDRVLGLEAGADDYVTKPFSPRELALRVASVLRRSSRPVPAPDRQILHDGPITVNLSAQLVFIDDIALTLTPREFDLLVFLLRNPGRVYSRESLLEQVWGWDFGDLSTVTVHIKRLRAKLGSRHRIDTVWGRGYAWGRSEITGEPSDA